MPNISQWEYDRLIEHQKEMYKLYKEQDTIFEAFKPLIKKVIQEMKEQGEIQI